MDIHLDTLSKYCTKIGCDVSFSIDTESRVPLLIILLGKDKNGGRKELIEFSDIHKILLLNDVIGVDSLIKKEISRKMDGVDDRIEILIYETLSKYIFSLFHASIKGEILYKEIKFLEMHLKSHFAG